MSTPISIHRYSSFLRMHSYILRSWFGCVLILLPLCAAQDVPPEPLYTISVASPRFRSTHVHNNLMNPWEEGVLFESDIMIPPDAGDRNGLSDIAKRWPNATIVYYIDKQFFNAKQRMAIMKAINDIERVSCVRFRAYRKGDTSFVRVRGKENGGCASFVGRLRGGQEVNLEAPLCMDSGHGTVLHELLHALGFTHQHSVPDRDKYIEIKWENISERGKKNFAIHDKVTDFNIGYDYGSVMHYSAFAGSKNDQPTIIPKDRKAKIGQRNGLSKKDIEKLNKMYGCVMKRKKPSFFKKLRNVFG